MVQQRQGTFGEQLLCNIVVTWFPIVHLSTKELWRRIIISVTQTSIRITCIERQNIKYQSKQKFRAIITNSHVRNMRRVSAFESNHQWFQGAWIRSKCPGGSSCAVLDFSLVDGASFSKCVSTLHSGEIPANRTGKLHLVSITSVSSFLSEALDLQVLGPTTAC